MAQKAFACLRRSQPFQVFADHVYVVCWELKLGIVCGYPAELLLVLLVVVSDYDARTQLEPRHEHLPLPDSRMYSAVWARHLWTLKFLEIVIARCSRASGGSVVKPFVA